MAPAATVEVSARPRRFWALRGVGLIIGAVPRHGWRLALIRAALRMVRVDVYAGGRRVDRLRYTCDWNEDAGELTWREVR